uniref:Uncharacterized protein n=1 Tax=Anguilla anguilla TaxID=7936 RepID=A0A0E9VRG1_ANGAN
MQHLYNLPVRLTEPEVKQTCQTM